MKEEDQDLGMIYIEKIQVQINEIVINNNHMELDNMKTNIIDL